jgi:hypothetical protein
MNDPLIWGGMTNQQGGISPFFDPIAVPDKPTTATPQVFGGTGLTETPNMTTMNYQGGSEYGFVPITPGGIYSSGVSPTTQPLPANPFFDPSGQGSNNPFIMPSTPQFGGSTSTPFNGGFGTLTPTFDYGGYNFNGY